MTNNRTFQRRRNFGPSHEHSNVDHGTLRARLAILLGVFAVPAFAAPGDFGALAGDAPIESEKLVRQLANHPAMPFEKAGMSFPGSAFYYLADPPNEALIALPASDPLNNVTDSGREVGSLIDVGPAASPFFSSSSALSHQRAHQCLSEAVWYEAASESEAGQRAVAQVVLNRVTHPSWPGTVCGVVYQGSSRSTGCQFTFTCDGSLSRKARGASWRRAQAIASDALAGSVYAPIGHATHYHTLWVNPSWAASLDHIGTIGAHRFYRNRGAGGQKAAFSGNYSGAEPGVATAIPSNTAPATGPSRTYRSETSVAQSTNESLNSNGGSNISDPSSATEAEYRSAGQVKDKYARAGQWKTNRSDDLDENADSPK